MGPMTQTSALGATGITTSALGAGTWQWGDRRFWGYGGAYAEDAVAAAYAASRRAGITFFDTAEIYGSGVSETLLGAFVRADPERERLVIATKYAPLPARLTGGTVARALDASLKRLGMERVDLYQVHWPYSLIRLDTLMSALADQVHAGKVRAIGVSNYSARAMRRAHELLARRGVPLASNQVHYSLLHRQPEWNGVLAACRELDVRLIAYSPLEQGILTGKFHADASARLPHLRRLQSGYGPTKLRAALPLIEALRALGEAHGGKTPAQVALSWLMRQGALPIPGAKNAAQAEANAGALGWELSDEEVVRLSKFDIR